MAIHPSGRVALSVGADRTLRLWDLIEGRSAYIKRLKVAADWARWAPDGLQCVHAARRACRSMTRHAARSFAVGEGSTAYIHRVDNAEVRWRPSGAARASSARAACVTRLARSQVTGVCEGSARLSCLDFASV